MKRLGFLALIVLAAIAPAPAQPKPFVIDAILSLSGTAASLGADEATGLAAYEKYVNRTGGLRGQPVHFEVVDDQSNPATAVQLANTILAKHPVAVIGSTLVGPTQAIAPLFKDGPVLYGSTPLFYPDKGGFIFSAGASSRFNTAATMRYFRMKGLTRFAFITTTDASGQDYLRTLDFALALPENKNVTVVDREVFNPSDISAASQAAHIKSSTAQVVYAYATGAPFGTALRALSDAAVDLPMITAGPNINPVLLDRFKSFLPKGDLVIGGASFLDRDRKPGDPLKGPIDDFYQELAGLGVRQPNVAHAFTWDPARIIVSGLRKLGPNATSSQLRDYIAGLNGFAGVSGMYDFRIGDQHGLTQDAQVVIQYDPSAPGNVRVVSRQGGAPL